MVIEQTTQIGYTLKTLAARTGMSIQFWRREIRLGRLPYVQFDQKIAVLPADLERYFAERRREGTRHQAETLASAA
jgi:hypothetical protein